MSSSHSADEMKLIKWKGNPEVDERHRFDFRWIKNKKEREEWIKKNWSGKDEI